MGRVINSQKNTYKLTAIAILTALIIVLQLLSTFIRFGTVSITLALAPIIIGAALFGKKYGAFLGFVMGTVIFITGVFGWDGGFMLTILGENPVFAILLCFGKSTAAGFLAGLVFELIEARSKTAAVITSGIVCPVVNTGLFFLGMTLFFIPMLKAGAAAESKSILAYLILTVAGINFVIELLVNLVLSSAITRIIQAVNKQNKTIQ